MTIGGRIYKRLFNSVTGINVPAAYLSYINILLQIGVLVYIVEAQWLGGRMQDSRSREPGHESPTYNVTIDGDILWWCYATRKTKSLNCTM